MSLRLLVATLFISSQLPGQVSIYASGSERKLLWRDPGAVERFDFAAGPGAEATPAEPFVFEQEESGGTSPKLVVNDSKRRKWSVKWGPEVKAEVFATRLVGAAGYIVEPSYYVSSGKIDSVGALGRAGREINRSGDNSFVSARFELRSMDSFPLPTSNWAFNSNPWVGTRELNGLKIAMMLVSNWDVKDERSGRPNTSILKVRTPAGEELHYIVNDWGGTMGKWGGIVSRSKWDCDGYARQSSDFVKGVDHIGNVKFGFQGKRRDDIAEGITVADVAWLMQYLGRVTDDQLRVGLQASGATPHEVECYTGSIRSRLEALRRVAGSRVQISDGR